MTEDSTWATVDIENAFNSVLRQAFMDELVAYFPALAKWVFYTYGCAALLFADTQTILATSGVQQGDPLGPLLFALALQPILKEIKGLGCNVSSSAAESTSADQGLLLRSNDLEVVAFLDDITIVAPNDSLAVQALQILHNRANDIGLQVSQKKSLLWQPRRQQPHQELLNAIKGLAAYHQESGIPLLGGSVTMDTQYAAQVAMHTAGKCIEGINALCCLQDPQVCLLLLRACLGMVKLNYCWRTTCPADALREATKAVDEALFEALQHIIGEKAQENFGKDLQFGLASLPVHQGGLGITLANDVVAFAPVASMLDTHSLQRQLFACLPDNSAFLNSELVRFNQFFALPPAMEKSMIAAPAAVIPMPSVALSSPLALSNNPLPPSKNQHHMATVYYKHKRHLIMQKFIACKDYAEFKVQHNMILHANAIANKSKTLASQWLFALPNPGIGQAMTPEEMRVALCYRMLMPIAARPKSCPHGTCGAVMDVFGYHALSCEGSGNHMVARHTVLQNALCGLAQYCGLHPRKEAVTCVWQATNGGVKHLRPADLLVDGDTFDRKLCVDVTIVSPLSLAKSATAAGRDLGKLVQQKAKEKIRKHQEPCTAAGYDFQPFALDVCGVVDSEAASLLKRFSTRQAERMCRPYSYVLSLARRRISTALHIGVARQLLDASKSQPHADLHDDSSLSACLDQALQFNESMSDLSGVWEEEEEELMELGVTD